MMMMTRRSVGTNAVRVFWIATLNEFLPLVPLRERSRGDEHPCGAFGFRLLCFRGYSRAFHATKKVKKSLFGRSCLTVFFSVIR